MLNHNLRIFMKVADRGSITETANELYISQPAISKAIRNLEKKLKVTLFYRDRRQGLTLTPIGEQILYYARQMEEIENHIEQLAYLQNNYLGGKLRIASFPIFTSTVLSKVIYRFRKTYPSIELELVDRDPQVVQQLVESHAVDLGISASPYTNVDHETLFFDRIVGVHLDDDASYPDIINLYGDTHQYIFCEAGKKTVTDTLRDAYKIHFSDSLIVLNHETIINMVEEGNGIGIISEFTLNSIPNQLIRCPVSPEITIDISLVAPDISKLTPAAEEFSKMLKSYLDNSEDHQLFNFFSGMDSYWRT